MNEPMTDDLLDTFRRYADQHLHGANWDAAVMSDYLLQLLDEIDRLKLELKTREMLHNE